MFKFESQQPEKKQLSCRLYPYLTVGGSVAIPTETVCKDPMALATMAQQALGADTHGAGDEIFGVCARHRCPTLTWSPPSSPCSWTEQIGGC